MKITTTTTKYILASLLILVATTTHAQTPGGVSGNNLLWMKADAETFEDASPGTDATEDADDVLQWHDQSGNSHDATVATGSYPHYDEDAFNFNPGLVFTQASSEWLQISGGIFDTNTVTGVSAYVVSSHSTASSQSVFSENLGSEDFMFLAQWTSDEVFWQVGSSTIGSGRATDPTWEASTDGTQYIWSMGNNSSNATSAGEEQYIRLDGHIVDIQDGYDASATGDNSDFFIGRWLASKEFDGTIAEIIIFDKILSATEEIQVQSYLAIKYGITLNDDADNDASFGDVVTGTIHEGDYLAADGTTEIWDYDNDKLFHFDVAGIGADATSGLDQRIGKSRNSDAIVTMCTEAIGTLNSDIGTALTDDTYLLWGNNNATTSAHDDLPAGYSGRLYKEWKVKMTGTVADVHVEFDISGEKLAGDATADFYLLTDADGDFTSGATATVATTFASGKVTFNDIDFTDGQYFTLASIQPGPGGVSNGLLLWMKADDQAHNTGTTLATDGQTVDNWHDQSTHDFDADDSGGTGPTWDADGCNYNPVLDFTGGATGTPLDIPTGIMESGTKTALYTYAVIATDLTQTQAVYFQDLNVGNANEYNSFITHYSNGNAYFKHGLNTREYQQASGITMGQYHLFSVKSDGADMQMWRDGNSLGTETDNGTATETTSYPFYIGERFDAAGNYFDGKIAELIILDHIPTAQETDQIESYLSMKYGITMAGAITMFDSDGTAVYADDATYDDGFVAIGRDDLSEWDQRQSKSIETDAVLTFSTTTIAATNALNGTQIAVDNSILFAAHNDGAADVSTSELHADFAERFTREWKVGEIGTVGNVLVEMDITGLVFAQEAAGFFGLVIDDDGDFTGGTQSYVIADDLTADKVTFNAVDFVNGKYFTLMNSSSALPVELIDFSATVEGCAATLHWSTASEINNDYFIVQFSVDGLNFEDIAEVDGAGNSTDIIEYSYTDSTCTTEGFGYYRIVQIDYDGSFTYFPAIPVELRLGYGVGFYPNPTSNEINIVVVGNDPLQNGKLIITNSFGKQVSTKTITNGVNNVNLSNLASGIYLVRVMIPGQDVYIEQLVML